MREINKIIFKQIDEEGVWDISNYVLKLEKFLNGEIDQTTSENAIIRKLSNVNGKNVITIQYDFMYNCTYYVCTSCNLFITLDSRINSTDPSLIDPNEAKWEGKRNYLNELKFLYLTGVLYPLQPETNLGDLIYSVSVDLLENQEHDKNLVYVVYKVYNLLTKLMTTKKSNLNLLDLTKFLNMNEYDNAGLLTYHEIESIRKNYSLLTCTNKCTVESV